MMLFLRHRRSLWLAGGILMALPLAIRAEAPEPRPLRVIIVGGGPDLKNNQVAIESNVRYVGKLLPRGVQRTTLFADGDTGHATVLFEEEARKQTAGERLLRLIMEGLYSGEESAGRYRKPNLGAKLDGPAQNAEISKVFSQVGTQPEAPNQHLFLYFTGHGSPDRGQFENNVMDLWGARERLSVRDLAKHLAQLPEEMPVTIVMVQCYSGAFANLIFKDGDPETKQTISRDIAGFFAAQQDRVAAGCTSAVNEAEYHDFTSYFFAALTGRDRVGRRVTGADYNHDGHVGMDEAFYYTIANDQSIDVPVCTSESFLRQFIPHRNTELFQVKYSEVKSWGTPAQRIVLESLSDSLKRSGEDRLQAAYRDMISGEQGQQDRGAEMRRTTDRFKTLRQESRRRLLERWPDLRDSNSPGYTQTRKEAALWLDRQSSDPEWGDLLKLEESLGKLEEDREAASIAAARLLRFVRLGKTIILTHQLRETGAETLKTRFDRLLAAESRSLLTK